MSRIRLSLSLGLLAAVVNPAHAAESAGPSAPVDYLRDVRPVLAAHCFKCHGPDENTRKAGLRLDSRDEALKPAKSGALAIVPGRPEASELVRRIVSADEDEVMPPPSTKHTLSEAQKEALKRWIAGGAEYPPHWAFVPPRRPPVPRPAGSESGEVHPIDAFVRARLEREGGGLKPAPEADRLTLIRRLSLDLIGLPPTPEEADAFVKDGSPGAYERLVDRLLASPHYGERWARRWMDLARYADTNGYEKDRPRSIWLWRDWVIRAFNDDLPFDRFTVEQIAGDLLPGATMDQRIATGFHRNTMLNEEGGIDPLEFRYLAMVDRVHTTATTWLGMTMACAQCHTHKYDPIQQREYFAFMAFLDNADEPEIDVPREDLAARRAEIEARAAALEADLPNRFPPPENLTWVTPAAERVSAASPAERLPDGSYRFGGSPADKDVYEFVYRTELTRVTGLNLDALADDALPSKGPGRTPHGNFVLSEVEVTASVDDSSEERKVAWAGASADFEQSGFPAGHAVDGKEGTGWAVAGEGRWNLNRRATFRFAEPVTASRGIVFRVRLVQQHGDRHLLGRVRLSFGVERPDGRPIEERRRENRERQLAAWQVREAERARHWVPLRPTSATSQVPVLTLEDDATVFVSSDQTKSDTYELRFDGELEGITALRLEVLPDDRLPRRGPGRVAYEGPVGDFFLSTIALSAGGEAVKLVRPSQTFADGGNTAARAIDDDPQSGWAINGGQGRRHVAVFNLETPTKRGKELRLTLLFEKYYAAGLGRFRLSATTDPRGAEAIEMPDDLQAVLRRPAEGRTAAESERLSKYFVGVAPELAAEREAIAKLRREMPSYPTTLVMQERPADNPRVTRVRHRGEFLQPKEPVTAALPEVFTAWVKEAPRNRLEFARWLVSRENPLSARVTVNRQWQAFFGRGLVRTMEDFGLQGELPTHPDLLDWLAVEFMDQGWSLKQLNRLIVTSATYRQSSRVTPEDWEKDPGNLRLARGPRFRLEGELVRDLALRSSGLLSTKVGGPSVFPPQLPGITKEGTYGPLEWKVSEGEDRYRRGLYTFAKRTAPYATFGTFDAPSGEACVARRDVSNTPLQALTLLNDEVFLEAAQALGRAASALDSDAAGKATFVFRRALTRAPTDGELARILEFYRTQERRATAGDWAGVELAGGGGGEAEAEAARKGIERAAWTAVARAILNLDETVTRG